MSGENPLRGLVVVAGLALACVLLSVVNPALLIFVPLALLLLGQPPQRAAAIPIGVLLLAFLFTGQAAEPVWYAERGWTLLVGAWLLLVAVVRPRIRFISRALAALGLAAASAAVVLRIGDGSWAHLDSLVAAQIRRDVALAGTFADQRFGADSAASRISAVAEQAADLTVLLYPAMLALASLAGLTLAWIAFRRLNGSAAQPLGRLREFRFPDELLWAVAVGMLLVVAPLGQEAARSGWNILVFMGALYGLRGAAVCLSVFSWPGPLGLLAGAVAVVLLYPLVMLAIILVGLSDSWLDLRLRQRGH